MEVTVPLWTQFSHLKTKAVQLQRGILWCRKGGDLVTSLLEEGQLLRRAGQLLWVTVGGDHLGCL